MPRLLLAVALALGLAAPSLAQSTPLTPGAERTALDYLRATAPAQGLSAADVQDLAVTAGHRSAQSGLSYVYVQQRLGGIDVVDGRATVAVDARGNVVHAAGGLVTGLAGTPSPSVEIGQALALAAAAVGADLASAVPTEVDPGPMRATTFGSVAGVPMTGRLVYAAQPREGVRLVWEMQVPEASGDHVWQVRLDAQNGLVVSASDLVVHEHVAPRLTRETAATPLAFVEAVPAPTLPAAEAAVAGYRVYPAPYESPIHAPTVPPTDGRTLVADPSDPTASPFGWHDTDGAAGAEYTVTWGNNVRAYQDRGNDNSGALADSPDGGAGLAFDFPLDLTADPSTYTDAAVTNLFYWNNVIHDVLYAYGFDEASGNFQENNYGNGGSGGDWVRAEAQDGGGTNNANMFTPADGGAPRMQMYEWTTATPRIDGDFDAGIVIHEYVHGLSNRLTGGPAAAGCLGNGEQMGEGWSDWYGLMLTQQAGDTAAQRRGIGTYALDQPTTGTGIRPAPYSTDFAVNGYTYADTQSGLSIPHGIGFVWSTILWEMTWDLIAAHGYDPDLTNGTGGAGNQIALALVTEGMKLQPCSPGFVDGRDGILAADAALYPDPARPGLGLHHDLLWAAFARRGLGASADQGSTGTNADNTEAFDLPLEGGVVEITPDAVTFAIGADETATADVSIANTGAPGTGVVQYQAVVTNLDQPDGAAPLAGGPDLFGYTFADSDEPGGPAVAFQDISATGTALALTAVTGYPADDEGYADVALPFAFPYYGVPQTGVRVMANGFLTFSAFAGESFNNAAVPGAGAPNAVIAPFWEDLDGAATSAIYTQTLPDGRFAVQWEDYRRYNDGTTRLTFQVLLAPDGDIEFQYETMTGTVTSGTVGIESANGTDGLGLAFNAPYVGSGLAVAFEAPLAWASVSPTSGDVAEGATAALTVSVDAAGLPDGTYVGDLVITTNDPEASSTTVPVTLTVGASATASVVVDGDRGAYLFGPPAEGMTVADLAAQNLVRGGPGYFPENPNPTLWTSYDTETGQWVAFAGSDEELALGRAFRWYFLDRDGVGDPAVSESRALPFTLSTDLPVNDRLVRITLDTDGNRWNHLANPFDLPLDVTGIRSWQGGNGVARNSEVYTYDPATSSWSAAAVVQPWQAFRFRAKGPRRNGSPRVLTIPPNARVPAGADVTAEPTTPAVRFSLDATAASGRTLADAMLTVAFDDAAAARFDDAEDTAKLQPLSTTYALVGARVGDRLAAVDVRAFAPAEIPLAVEARGTEGEMTLRWDASTLPAGQPVTLVDLATGAEIDVRTRDAYTFLPDARPALDAVPTRDLADASAATDRFVLRIGAATASAADIAELTLDAPAPNPSAASARIAFAMPEAGTARVTVFDARGRQVAVLVDGAVGAGRHEATLDSGSLAAGVYVVRLEALGQVIVRQAVVVR